MKRKKDEIKSFKMLIRTVDFFLNDFEIFSFLISRWFFLFENLSKLEVNEGGLKMYKIVKIFKKYIIFKTILGIHDLLRKMFMLGKFHIWKYFRVCHEFPKKNCPSPSSQNHLCWNFFFNHLFFLYITQQ